jgi:hypothetical protein
MIFVGSNLDDVLPARSVDTGCLTEVYDFLVTSKQHGKVIPGSDFSREIGDFWNWKRR